MARNRQCRSLIVGGYQGAAIWQSGSGIEMRTRYADGIGIKVDEKWVYLYLRDGEEIVRLSRKTNKSAQIYPEMTLQEVMRERVINRVENSSSCCWGEFGRERHNGVERTPCKLHTTEWLEDEIQSELDSIVSDEEWPSVLAERKIDAVKASQRLAELELEREAARDAGYGEWRKSGDTWLVSIEDHCAGDIVAVRRRNGAVSHHELTVQVTPKLFRVGEEIPEADAEARKARQNDAFAPSPKLRNVLQEKPELVEIVSGATPENVRCEMRKSPHSIRSNNEAWSVREASAE